MWTNDSTLEGHSALRTRKKPRVARVAWNSSDLKLNYTGMERKGFSASRFQNPSYVGNLENRNAVLRSLQTTRQQIT